MTVLLPYAPSLRTPVDGGIIISSMPTVFTWDFYAPGPNIQAAADFRYKLYGDVSWTTVTGAATTDTSYTLPASTWPGGDPTTTDSLYEWQVRTYGIGSAAGPWSNSFWATSINALATPTITAPAAGSTPASSPVTLSWTTPWHPTSAQVRRTSATGGGGTIYYSLDRKEGLSQSVPIPLDAVTRTDFLAVQYAYEGYWSPWASVSINVAFGPPHTPLITAAVLSDAAAVAVSITNPAASTGFEATVSNDLYRDGIRIATGLPVNGAFTDRLPGAGSVNYVVEAFAANGIQASSY